MSRVLIRNAKIFVGPLQWGRNGERLNSESLREQSV